MKTFNKKLLSTTFLATFLLSGCMPDSLTQFKKDPPKKATSTTTDGGGTTAPPVDDDGNVIDTTSFVDPGIFKYRQGDTSFSTMSLEVTRSYTFEPVFDGTILLGEKRDKILKKCELVSSTPLPPGLNLIPETCNISGIALQRFTDTSISNYGKPIPYTIRLTYLSKSGSYKTLDTTVSLGVYDRLSPIGYTQNDKLLLRLTQNLTTTIDSIKVNIIEDDPYDRNGLISTVDGTVGVVKFVDASTQRIGVVKIIPIEVEDITAISYFDTSKTPPTEQYPSLTTARFISNNADTSGSNDAVGKVVKLYRPSTTSTRGIIYVETISDGIYFQDGQYIDDVKSYVGSATRITTKNTTAGTLGVDDQFVIRRINNSFIVDNDYQFFTENFGITSLVRVFEPGTSIESGPRIKVLENPTIEEDNGVTFTVSPALPSGLNLDPKTGEITGTFASTLDGSSFVVTATNPLGSVNTQVGLGAIYAPKDFNYSTRQLISVASSVKFNEGETLYQPITPPMEQNIKARILRKITTTATNHKLSIETQNGSFVAGVSLDSGNAYFSEKSYVPSTAITPTSTTAATTPIIADYNIALTLTSTTNFDVDGYISNAGGAVGRIVYKDGTTLYIQQFTPGDPAVLASFSQGESVRNAEVYASGTATTTISQVESSNLKITINADASNDTDADTFADFRIGNDITSSGNLAAYTYDIDATDRILSISDITKKPSSAPYFVIGQTLYAGEEVSTGPTRTITAVSSDNTLFLEVGTSVELKSQMKQGNNLIFSVKPALPTGLTLNTRTGVITGKPTLKTSMKEYVVSAINLNGRVDYVFNMEVRDYFKIVDLSGAPSFVTHKYGSFQQYRSCRINATDVIEAQGSRDVRCFIDAEEQDLHNIKLKLQTSVGPGICEFVNVTPFSFQRYAPLQTSVDPSTERYVVRGQATAATPGVPAGAKTDTPTADMCAGNYTAVGGPNCDEGSFQYIIYTGADADDPLDGVQADEVVASDPVTVNCGGKKAACIDGPVRDLLDDTQMNTGFRGLIYTSSAGLSSTQTFSAPLDKANSTNLRAANGSIACKSNQEEATDWVAINKAQGSTTHPFAQGSPYYTFSCLDSAKETKARIRIVVRDWDRTFKITSDIDLDIPLLPANTMNAGVLIDGFGEAYNSYQDWDDQYATSSGSCSDFQYKTQTTCLAGGEVWTANTAAANYGGTCAFPAGAADRHKFPGSNL